MQIFQEDKMKTYKKHHLIFSTFLLILLMMSQVFAGTTERISNKFSVDTRDLNPTPQDGWQNLTRFGETFNEDMLIDNFGKTWCFYSINSDSPRVPIYLKIYKTNGYVYKIDQIAGFGSPTISSELNSNPHISS